MWATRSKYLNWIYTLFYRIYGNANFLKVVKKLDNCKCILLYRIEHNYVRYCCRYENRRKFNSTVMYCTLLYIEARRRNRGRKKNHERWFSKHKIIFKVFVFVQQYLSKTMSTVTLNFGGFKNDCTNIKYFILQKNYLNDFFLFLFFFSFLFK